MGGTQAEFDRRRQYELLSNDLVHVMYYVYISNIPLLDVGKLQGKFEKIIGIELEKNGIQSFQVVGVGGGGGGGGETFWEIIKFLWGHREILTFLVSMFQFIKTFYINLIKTSVKSSYPLVDAHFIIDANSKVDKLKKNELDSVFSESLANLLIVTNSILSAINSDYPAFRFNLSVEGRVNSIGYSTTFRLDHHSRISKESRIIEIIQNLRLRSNTSSDYQLSKFDLVKRSDRYTKSNGVYKFNDYYLFFSKNIISDYFKRNFNV